MLKAIGNYGCLGAYEDDCFWILVLVDIIRDYLFAGEIEFLSIDQDDQEYKNINICKMKDGDCVRIVS